MNDELPVICEETELNGLIRRVALYFSVSTKTIKAYLDLSFNEKTVQRLRSSDFNELVYY